MQIRLLLRCLLLQVRETACMPVLVRRWLARGPRTVELWQTSCIVTQPPGEEAVRKQQALVNPANEFLSGTSNFPYFPRGGQVPGGAKKQLEHSKGHSELGCKPLHFATSWGGMDAGENMVYPAQAVDGMVHIAGGKELALACQLVPEHARGIRCPVGTPVSTPPGSSRLSAH